MPRFFFHSYDDGTQLDREGTELPDLATARRMAVKLAGAEMLENPAVLDDVTSWRTEVADEEGCVVFAFAVTPLANGVAAAPVRERAIALAG